MNKYTCFLWNEHALLSTNGLIYLIAEQKMNYGMQRMQNQNDNRAKQQSDKLWWRAYGLHMKTLKPEDTND